MIEELPDFTNCRFLECFFLAFFFPFSAVIFVFVGGWNIKTGVII